MEREGETETETKRGEIRVTAAHRNRAEQFQTPCVAKNGQAFPFRKNAPLRIILISSWSVATRAYIRSISDQLLFAE